MSGRQPNFNFRPDNHHRNNRQGQRNNHNGSAASSSNGGQPLFPAYRQDESRAPPAGFVQHCFPQHSRVEMEASLALKKAEERIKKERREKENWKRQAEEQSNYSIKHVTLDDSEESDEGIQFMAPIAVSTKEENQSGSRKRRHKHKKHKSRRQNSRSNSASSASSSGSDTHSHRNGKKRRKESKRSRRSRSPVPSGSSQNGNSQATQSGSIFDHGVNPWKLLVPKDYNYKVSHMVVHNQGDAENLKYDKSYKNNIAQHRTLNNALSTRYYSIPLSQGPNDRVSEKNRYFCRETIKSMKKPAERFFRSGEQIGTVGVDRILISSMPCSHGEILAKNEWLPNQIMPRNMDLDTFENIKHSEEVSYEEASLEGKQKILQGRVATDSRDVESWIAFVQLQDKFMAQYETGDPSDPVRNTNALHERKDDILKKAIHANPRSVDLHLEKLKLIEARYGINSPEARKEWDFVENRFISNLRMWKMSIQAKQNDRTTFDVESLISHIDKCIRYMVNLKNKTIKSHNADPNTEDFLVDLLVHRCKLLIEVGFIDRAIASMQALAEFHFFHPISHLEESRKEKALQEMFKTFWNLGAARIGDDGAIGWKIADYSRTTFDEEKQQLEVESARIKENEAANLNRYRESNYSTPAIWKRLEQSRESAYWRPVRNNQAVDLYEHESRFVSYDQISPIIFRFFDKKCAVRLIFELLQLFGAEIPGVKSYSQEAIIQQFSSTLFPKYSPNLNGIGPFLLNFLMLLSKADGFDVERAFSASIQTHAKFLLSSPALIVKEKKKALNGLSKEFLESGAAGNTKTAITVTYYMLKLHEVYVNKHEGSNKVVESGMNLLKNHKQNIWSIKDEKERLIHLKWARAVIRRLPFSDDLLVKNESGVMEESLSKKDFLVRLGVSGNGRQIEMTPENVKIAKRQWDERMKLACADSKIDQDASRSSSEFSWIANEAEITLELAATFYYENLSTGLGLETRLELFDTMLRKSALAQKLNGSPVIHKLKYSVYKNHMKRSAYVLPKNLISLLKDAIMQFPAKISFLKKFLTISNTFNARLFLQMNPGDDEISRRMRSCAQIYLESKRQEEMKNNNSGGSGPELVRRVVEKAAPEQSSLPDSYLWCLLQAMEQNNKSSETRLDEVFTLGQKQCPWSKRFLVESATDRTHSSEHLAVIESCFNTTGLQMYCRIDEVPILMQPDVEMADFLAE